MTGGMKAICAFLDAAAFQLDLAAAAGRQSLIRGPLAMSIRATSRILRFWNTTWVGRYLGIAWVLRTFWQGRKPPPKV
jgi:hypothetical protein